MYMYTYINYVYIHIYICIYILPAPLCMSCSRHAHHVQLVPHSRLKRKGGGTSRTVGNSILSAHLCMSPSRHVHHDHDRKQGGVLGVVHPSLDPRSFGLHASVSPAAPSRHRTHAHFAPALHLTHLSSWQNGIKPHREGLAGTVWKILKLTSCWAASYGQSYTSVLGQL